MNAFRRLIAGLLLCILLPCSAGVLTREALEKSYPAPWMIGQKDEALPVWPVYKQNGPATDLVGYLFESIDFVSVPGFAGVPVDLLIAIDPQGTFLDVKVLSQHEPVFLDGLGEGPLHKFVSQYQGVSLKQNVVIDSATNKDGTNVHIDGVAKATASVRIVNQTLLSAALKVARKKLGFSAAQDPDRIAKVRQDVLESIRFADLKAEGLLQSFLLRNVDVEKAFEGSDGADLDPAALQRPNEVFADLEVALVSVPSIGRSLLDVQSWSRLASRLEEGDHALLVRWRGNYAPISERFIAGTPPDRFTLIQGGLPIEMRDLNLDLRLQDGARDSMKVFRVIAQAGLDPSQPLDLALHVTRLKGMIYPERFVRDFRFAYRLPERFVTIPPSEEKSWMPAWKQRWPELAIVAAALVLLFAALSKPAILAADARRFAWFRAGFLAFTLLFIGWYAQGQLSIVTLTGIIHAVKEGASLAFLMYDPVSILIWAAVGLSLFAWGRGTFCGWLCPFGALQELTGKLGQWGRLPQVRLRQRTDARLRLVKYGVLAVLVCSVFVSERATGFLVEVEPFKTAITLGLQRHWPYVLYATALLAASAVWYKFFCRYLCPLGAGLALFGRVRLFDWLPRRNECGKPCQTCRHRCDYSAIQPDGGIRYDDCFQCMDCVVIHQSDERCAPLILEKKRRVAIPVKAA
ncbi:4Fe-4S binding protein [Noviherbaspirillum sp. ST9]|uniref:4Fe-4S binding protein n=1 Tax=Noviherbaspirillum sp. ST9 TaxID=3401606 RepID=UPI003B58B290